MSGTSVVRIGISLIVVACVTAAPAAAIDATSAIDSTTTNASEGALNRWHRSYADGLQALHAKHFAASKKLLDLALSQAEKLPVGEVRAQSLSDTYSVFTAWYDEQKQYQMADVMQQKSLANFIVYLGPVHPFVAQKLYGDGYRYLRHHQPFEAEKLFRQAIEMQEKLGSVRMESAIALAGLAKSLQMQHRYSEAEELFKTRLMKFYPACKDLDCRLKDLADCYSAQGRIVEARPFYKRAREVELQYRNLRLAMRLSDAADLQRVRKRFRDSEILYKKALAITQKCSQPNSEEWKIMQGYAFLLSEVGRKEEAREVKVTGRRLMEEYHRVCDVPTGQVMQ